MHAFDVMAHLTAAGWVGIDRGQTRLSPPTAALDLMSAASSRRKLLIRRFTETMAYGAGGAAVLGLAGMPAGWLSGAIIGVSAAALSGRPMYMPPPVARAVYVILGISLGSSVTPSTIASMVTWPLSMIALAIAMTAITASVTIYLKLVHGWPTLDALFAAAPGALAQAMALAQDTGANVRAIALVQTVRLFVLAVALPLIFAAFGVMGVAPPRGGNLPMVQLIFELGVIILVSSGAALLAFRLNLPGGLILGSMAASGILHGTGWVHAFLPVPVVIFSFIIMGSMIGTRLGGADLRQLLRLSLVGLGALLVGTSVGCLFAVGVAWLLGLRTDSLVIAYAPGAMEAMTIIAFALHLDPVFVGVHQLARFTFMSLVLPGAVGVIRAWEGHAKKDAE
ncbi:MAG TPA: AbrB family transcriptional regulator [Xanthobacteraceae bacterium]|jgi:membrane AbrB-like protein|nr:AbrB family transcriptional regulator [Xanthobacteraceae bacterium]